MTSSSIYVRLVPFLFSYALSVLGRQGIPPIASSVSELLAARKNMIVNGDPKEFAILVATTLHAQVTFFVTTAIAVVTGLCTALNLENGATRGVTVVGLLMLTLAVWYFRWSIGARTEENSDGRDREMFWGSIVVTTVCLIASL